MGHKVVFCFFYKLMKLSKSIFTRENRWCTVNRQVNWNDSFKSSKYSASKSICCVCVGYKVLGPPILYRVILGGTHSVCLYLVVHIPFFSGVIPKDPLFCVIYNCCFLFCAVIPGSLPFSAVIPGGLPVSAIIPGGLLYFVYILGGHWSHIFVPLYLVLPCLPFCAVMSGGFWSPILCHYTW